MYSFLDHLVIGVPDLAVANNWALHHFGQSVVYGGQHKGFGTHNALLGIGTSTYLEFLAPDPQQTPPASDYWMNVDQIEAPQLIRWAARSHQIHEDAAKAAAADWELGAIVPGNRQRSDGSSLHWQLSDPNQNSSQGILPFLIDWRDSPHPAKDLPQVGRLLSLTLAHPEAGRIQQQLASIGIDLPVTSNLKPGLSALISSDQGTVLLA